MITNYLLYNKISKFYMTEGVNRMADDYISNEIYTPQIGGMQTKWAKKLLNIFFLVDVSGSMREEGRINAVNEAFTQMIPALRQIQMDSMSELELRIAIMTFSQAARWIVPPTSILEFKHKEITCDGGIANYSAAFKALREKLTRKEYMAHSGKIAAPNIFIVTDGDSDNNDNLQFEMKQVLSNGWVKVSEKFIVLSEIENAGKLNRTILEFVGLNQNRIIKTEDIKEVVLRVVLRLFFPPQYFKLRDDMIPKNNAIAEEYTDPFDDEHGWFGGFEGFGDFDDNGFI